MVHQHFMLVPPLTVTENIMLGQEAVRPATRFLGLLAPLDRKAAAARIRELSHRHGLDIDPEARVGDLSVGAQQRVEIVKALYRSANDPDPRRADRRADAAGSRRSVSRSCAGWPAPARRSFSSRTSCARSARSPDRISVMRGGRMVGTTTPSEATPEMLAEMMVGRQRGRPPREGAGAPGWRRAARRRLSGCGTGRRAPAVERRVARGARRARSSGWPESSATARANSSRRSPACAASQAARWRCSARTSPRDPAEIIERGVAHVPEDRHKHGLVLSFPVRDNLVLCTYYTAPFARGWMLDEERIGQQADALVREYDVRTPGTGTRADALSGGNQQKVVIARELSRAVKLLVVNQPTRGLDVGSVEFIHQRIVAARDRGVAVLLVSAELDEVLSLSDRIAVMLPRSHRSDPRRTRRDARAAGPADGRRRGGRPCLAGLRRAVRSDGGRTLAGLREPGLALVLAFSVGALVIWATSGSLGVVVAAYGGMISGAFFKTRGLSETLVAATPYVFLGLGLALGFRPGCSTSASRGSSSSVRHARPGRGAGSPGLPAIVHLPLALGAGAAGGALWAVIPAYLKVKTGAHEVIN